MGLELSAAIAAAAKDRLGRHGLTRKGRSRIWLDDHGWWLVMVEFQAASSGRFYVNVGEQHLFIRRDRLVFEGFERPLGGTWTGDGSEEAIDRGVAAAVDAVLDRRARHNDGHAALRRLATTTEDDLVAGVAAALLGDIVRARARLTGHIHSAERPVADAYLAAVDQRSVSDLAKKMTADTRKALALPRSERVWTP